MKILKLAPCVFALVWATNAAANTTQIQCDSSLTAPAAVSASRPVDTIVARISIHTNPAGESRATFERPGESLRGQFHGDGAAMMSVFGEQRRLVNPTTARIEERAVFNDDSLRNYLSQTAASNLIRQSNNNVPLVWEPRDKPRVGHTFITMTEIGGLMNLDLRAQSGEKIRIGVKPRYRSYFEIPVSDSRNPEKAVRALDGLLAFELKFTSLQGPGNNDFLSLPDESFKPRFWVTADLADRLRAISGRDAEFREKLDAIARESSELTGAGGTLINNPKYVLENIEFLKATLLVYPDFLQPRVVTKVRRSSFFADTAEGQYQFTADDMIEIFHADNAIAAAQVSQYLTRAPLYAGSDGSFFVELKSPVKAASARTAMYTELKSQMTTRHDQRFKIGAGKFSLARYTTEKVGDQPVDMRLFEYGTDFWLLTSTGQLDSLRKKNDILEGKRLIQIAIPVRAKNDQRYRLVLQYEPAQGDGTSDTSRSAYLRSLEIINAYGERVELDRSVRAVLGELARSPMHNTVAIEFEGVIIPFRDKLTYEERLAYKDFFTKYFYKPDINAGPERDIERLARLQTPQDLEVLNRQIKRENFVKLLKDRWQKGVVSAISVGIVFAGANSAIPYVQDLIANPPPAIEQFFNPQP